MRLLLLLGLAVLALVVYSLIDCMQTNPAMARTLPKPVWLLLILAVPLVGAVAWLVSGRPESAAAPTGGPGWPRPSRPGTSGYVRPKAPLGPDDDPDFLRQIRAIDAEHQRTLEEWERDLRERERRLRGDPPTDGTPPPDGPPPADGSPGPAPSGGPH